jgi:4-hydroxybenzoate polyprenyltransferase
MASLSLRRSGKCMSDSPNTIQTGHKQKALSTTSSPSSISGNLRGLLKTMRIRQWTKNSFVLAPLVFDGKLFELPMLAVALLATFCFCLASSSVYLLNDLVDIEKDRQHPRKRLRPLPSGQLNPAFAGVMAFLLAVVSIAAIGFLNLWAAAVVGLYLLQNLAYSFYLKNFVILDVIMIAVGFVLRVVAGVLVVDVQNFSPWLYVCASLLALFLGFGKRRHEIALLEDGAASHRASLDHYTLPFLDQIISIVTTSALIAYTFYSFESQTALAGGGKMLLTVPFVFYGVLRYLYLIHVRKLGGAPDELLLQDMPFLASILLWVLSVIVVIYV